jgi:hypothetical protein
MSASRSLLPRRELLALVAQLREIEGAAPVEPDTEPFVRVDESETYEREPSSPAILPR